MVGGGFIDGIVFHPKAKGIRYCRTDIGGAYRWNEGTKMWEPLMDWVPDEENNLMGVESIALDANDPDRVYLACGTYTTSKGPNAILRSTDKGKTFKRTDVPFRMGGNENGRGHGERMAVDPNNGNNLYMGTRLDGLWQSRDAGATWAKVVSFPQTAATGQTGNGSTRRGNGIVFVLFDAASGKKHKGSKVVYAGVAVKGQNNLFVSRDNGLTWDAVDGQPNALMPTHAALATDGNLYLSYGSNPGPDAMTDGAVWKYNTTSGLWTDITPVKPEPANQKAFGYAAVAVDARHPQAVIASTFNRYGNKGGEDIFRTIDGGKTWKPIFTGEGKGRFDYAIAPYVSHTGIHWLFDIEIDPANPNHALFTTGYGGHETFNLLDVDRDKPTVWAVMDLGVEETVVLAMISPPQGAPLISAIGDYGGFVHWDLDKSPAEGNFSNPRFSNTNAIAFAPNKPDVIVRVGEGAPQTGGGNMGYSLNGGKSWQKTTSVPTANSRGGYVAVSANGKNWAWAPQNSAVYYTHDCGTNWYAVTGLPNNTKIIADSENPEKFYAVNLAESILYTSTDGAMNFNAQPLNLPGPLPGANNLPVDKRAGTNQLYAAPGNEGDLWLATVAQLYHSTNGGQSFVKAGDAKQVRAFGFGKAAPGAIYPALYLIGTVNSISGVYRSDDMAKSWVRINDAAHQWGLLLQITGDPKVYGRVYVGTHGRGILYGDPLN